MNPSPTLKSTDDEIISFITSWIDEVIAHGYSNASELLDTPWEKERSPFSESDWNEELECYGSGWKVTDPRKIKTLRKEVYRYNDGSGYAVDYDLAINDERSDHTLQFDFTEIDGRLNISLDHVHVL